MSEPHKRPSYQSLGNCGTVMCLYLSPPKQRLASLVPSLFTPQIFIPYSISYQGGKSGRKCYDDVCRKVMEASHVVLFNLRERHSAKECTNNEQRTRGLKRSTSRP